MCKGLVLVWPGVELYFRCLVWGCGLEWCWKQHWSPGVWAVPEQSSHRAEAFPAPHAPHLGLVWSLGAGGAWEAGRGHSQGS